MEVILKDSYDIIDEYSNKRITVTYEDAEDLLSIFVKYLRLKMKSNDYYAINTPLGIFYKALDRKMLAKAETRLLKEELLNEKTFLNSKLKKRLYREYNYEDIELIKKNTNNHLIKA